MVAGPIGITIVLQEQANESLAHVHRLENITGLGGQSHANDFH